MYIWLTNKEIDTLVVQEFMGLNQSYNIVLYRSIHKSGWQVIYEKLL